MQETLVQSAAASYWEDLPFHLPPLPWSGRFRKALTNIICFAGMTIAGSIRALRPAREPVTPRSFLIIRRGGLGDVLMATPLLRALRMHFPLARIYALVSKQAAPGLAACPWVDQTLEIPQSKKDWLPLLRQLRRDRIDAAFILHRFFAPSLVACLAGIPQRLGFEWKNHGFALTRSIPFSAARSQALQIGQLLTLLGKPAAEPDMQFAVSNDAIRRARELLHAWGFDSARPLVGIHPGGGQTPLASDPARRWLPERFAQLADLLEKGGQVQVVLLQGPGDEAFVDEVLMNMTVPPLGKASGLPLEVFAALLRECNLMVANDSGPMHLAAAQQTPVVAIIGPTHPAYAPPQGKMHRVIRAEVPCSPCYHPEEYVFKTRRNGKKMFECWRSTHECMAAITAEEVYNVVIRQIEAADSTGKLAGQRSGDQARTAQRARQSA